MQAHNDVWLWTLYATGLLVHISKRASMAVCYCNLVSGDPASGSFRATVAKF